MLPILALFGIGGLGLGTWIYSKTKGDDWDKFKAKLPWIIGLFIALILLFFITYYFVIRPGYIRAGEAAKHDIHD